MNKKLYHLGVGGFTSNGKIFTIDLIAKNKTEAIRLLTHLKKIHRL